METSPGQGSNRLDSMTPEERETVAFLAERAGVSSEEYMREFEEEFAQLSPEAQAEFEAMIDALNGVLPDLHKSLDRIEQTMSRCRSTMREMREQMAAMSDGVSCIEDALMDGFLD